MNEAKGSEMDKELHHDAHALSPHARRAWLGYARQMDRDLKKIGLTISQYALLAYLQEKGKSSMRPISRELGITMGAGTNLADKLVRSGLATRGRDEGDHRVVWIEITENGRGALKSAEAVAADYLAFCMADLDAAKRKALVDTLSKVAAKIASAPSGRTAQ
jgi:DNA-binding MarR family transcriptional regulator